MSTSPDSDHVEVGLFGILQQLLVAVIRLIRWVYESRVLHVKGHIVGSFAVDRIFIDEYCKFFLMSVQSDSLYTIWNLFRVDYLAFDD